MLTTAHARGFHPQCVLCDSWYSGLPNLKLIRDWGWTWLTRFKDNRLVNPDRSGNRPLRTVTIAESGTGVHLKGYGLVKVFMSVTPDGDSEYWATNDLDMTELTRLSRSEWAWTIENYHRGLKQFCGVEKCQARAARPAQSYGLRHSRLSAARAFLVSHRHQLV